MMRIAYLSTFYPFRGGISQFNTMLYRTLVKQEHEVKAFTFCCQYPAFLFPGKTQYVEDYDAEMVVDTEVILSSINPFSYEKTARAILRWKPDVLYVSYWMSFFVPSLGHVVKRLKKKGIPTLCIIHNVVPHEPHFFDKPLTRLFFNQCAEFVVMNQTVKNDLLRLKPDACYILKPHPLYNQFGAKIEQTEAQKRLGLDSCKKTLLFFGLIRDYKGLDLLIQAMSLLDDSYQLIIAGESYGDFTKYRLLIDASPAKERIFVWNRYINDYEVPVLFSAADVLVTPYRSATQSGVIPIAYHFETPVLATNVGGLKESIEKPGTGLVCLPQTDSLANGIHNLFQSDTEVFATNIRKEKKKLSWEAFAEALVQLAETQPSPASR